MEKSMMIRFLIHVIGDLHQPLHGATKITPENPLGDLGGNLCNITFSEGIDNLHKLFDSCLAKVKEVKRVRIIVNIFSLC